MTLGKIARNAGQGRISNTTYNSGTALPVDTVMRDRKMAKAWLLRELRQPAAVREER